MQNGDDTGPSAADRVQQAHRVELVGRIEGGDRLVGEQDLGLDRECRASSTRIRSPDDRLGSARSRRWVTSVRAMARSTAA